MRDIANILASTRELTRIRKGRADTASVPSRQPIRLEKPCRRCNPARFREFDFATDSNFFRETKPMRAILILLGLAALALVVMLGTGMLNLNMQGGSLPKVTAETGRIDVGSTNKSVELPTVEMKDATVSLPTIDVKPAASPTPAAQ
jgi:hypothetical protein